MRNKSIASANLLFVCIFGLVVVMIYALPYFATWATVGFSDLPPMFASDLHLYLNLSDLNSASSGMVLNPWYGISVPTGDVTLLKFGSAVRVFGSLKHLLMDNWTVAVFLWNITWTIIIFISALWLFQTVLVERSLPIVALSLAVFLLFDLVGVQQTASAWLGLPAFQKLFSSDWPLPYTRMFYPQVAIPLILAYIVLQIQALRFRSWVPWIVMGFVQFLTLASFPYATALLAVMTGLTFLFVLLSRKLVVSWKYLIGYGLLCFALDGLLLLANGSASSLTGYSRAGTFLVFDLSQVRLHVGGYLILMLAMTVMIALLGDQGHPQIKWTLVGLGTANTLLYLTDIFVSPILQISEHIGYFFHMTLAILAAYLGARACTILSRRYSVVRWIVVAGILFILINGGVASIATYNRNLAFNTSQAELARLITSLDLHDKDLVFAPAGLDSDTAVWIPLLTKSHVLFARKAEFVLPVASAANIYRYRQALYFYFIGRDRAWIEERVSKSGMPGTDDLVRIFERPLLTGQERTATLLAISQDLILLLLRIEGNDPEIQQFFHRYDRVLVIDRIQNLTFVPDRLTGYLNIVSEKRTDTWQLEWYQPK